MTHDDPYEQVTLDRAAELIGGDRPISRTTLQRMINAGVIEARGQGRLRRATVASIDAYRRGETTWRGDARGAQAAPIRTETANGGRKSRSGAGAPGGRVRLIGRTPRRNSKS